MALRAVVEGQGLHRDFIGTSQGLEYGARRRRRRSGTCQGLWDYLLIAFRPTALGDHVRRPERRVAEGDERVERRVVARAAEAHAEAARDEVALARLDDPGGHVGAAHHAADDAAHAANPAHIDPRAVIHNNNNNNNKQAVIHTRPTPPTTPDT